MHVFPVMQTHFLGGGIGLRQMIFYGALAGLAVGELTCSRHFHSAL